MVAITQENQKFLVCCRECERSMKRITNTHLSSCCGLSMDEYAQKHKITKKELLWLPERRHHSNCMEGEGNPTFGITRTKEWRSKISNATSGKKRPKISEERLRRKKEKGYLQSKQAREKQSNSLKKRFREDKEWAKRRRVELSNQFKNLWADKDFKDKHLKKILNTRLPTKPERELLDLIKRNNLPFRYVGDGKWWARDKNNSFNPDFLGENTKHIIEVFGDYWHTRPEVKLRDKKRLETYSKRGYKTLVIWQSELQNAEEVLERIRCFLGEEVANIYSLRGASNCQMENSNIYY